MAEARINLRLSGPLPVDLYRSCEGFLHGPTSTEPFTERVVRNPHLLRPLREQHCSSAKMNGSFKGLTFLLNGLSEAPFDCPALSQPLVNYVAGDTNFMRPLCDVLCLSIKGQQRHVTLGRITKRAKYLIWWPTGVESLQKQAWAKADSTCPLRESQRFSLICQVAVIPFVIVLLHPGCVVTVRWPSVFPAFLTMAAAIVSIIVSSLNRILRPWSAAQISKKLLERMPRTAKFYAAATIVLKRGISRVQRSASDPEPGNVFGRLLSLSCFSVRTAVSLLLQIKTPTTFGSVLIQRIGRYFFGPSAITNTKPIGSVSVASRLTYGAQAIKSLTWTDFYGIVSFSHCEDHSFVGLEHASVLITLGLLDFSILPNSQTEDKIYG